MIAAHASTYAALFLFGAVITRRRPINGLSLLIAVIPFAFYLDIGPTTMTLSKAALLGVAAGLFTRKERLKIVADRRVLTILLAAFVIEVLTALSYVHAQYKVPVIRETLKALEYIVALALAMICYEEAFEARMVGVLFVIAASVSLVALVQEFSGAPSAILLHGHVVGRIAGSLEGPNQLGGYLGLALPIMVAFALHWRRAPIAWGVIGLCALTLLLTFSRAGILCAIVAVAIVFAIAPSAAPFRRVYRIIAGLAIIISAALVFIGELTHALSWGSEPQPNGLGTRSELWDAAWKLWQRHPWLGIGAGNFELELGQAGYPELHTHANNGYLQALVEEGIPGLLALLWLVWLSLSSFIYARARGPLVVGVFGAMAGMALHEFFDYLLFYPKVGLMFWLLFGVGVAGLAVADSRPLKSTENALG